MKQKLDVDSWNRKEHFRFFNSFDQPYFGVTVDVDCTRAYQNAKDLDVSFYSYYLHKILAAVNAVESFKYGIDGEDVYISGRVDASTTILRDDKTFGLSYIRYEEDIHDFHQVVIAEIERVKNTTGIFTTGPLTDVIHFSALPWVSFNNISQAHNNKSGDSCPKITVGKLTEANGIKSMPVHIHVHHGLVDGYHVGLYIDKLQQLLDG
ncbi:chloramphenicol acetyltransferase [Mucilaginibacter mali]|uniref:Chloramphenicol acetyltransferase n=1 Tax=Mucilaginibacter mali TaxID=2740462 RepID=A0A7D4QVP7_9SPHI|nr:chloramphenicol acetyltransferase [Mucilaginibacter mali]QKJ31809.1 chloramphenicol acetyltransferase [Mucilaginibacter mali]